MFRYDITIKRLCNSSQTILQAMQSWIYATLWRYDLQCNSLPSINLLCTTKYIWNGSTYCNGCLVSEVHVRVSRGRLKKAARRLHRLAAGSTTDYISRDYEHSQLLLLLNTKWRSSGSDFAMRWKHPTMTVWPWRWSQSLIFWVPNTFTRTLWILNFRIVFFFCSMLSITVCFRRSTIICFKITD